MEPGAQTQAIQCQSLGPNNWSAWLPHKHSMIIAVEKMGRCMDAVIISSQISMLQLPHFVSPHYSPIQPTA